MLAFVWLWFTGGCGVTADPVLLDLEAPAVALPLAQAPPPSGLPPEGAVVLEHDPLIPGARVTLRATGVPAGAQVYFVREVPVGDPCPPALGGACFSLDAFAFIAAATATDQGAAIQVRLPVTLPPGREASFQAAYISTEGTIFTGVSTSITGEVCGDGACEGGEACGSCYLDCPCPPDGDEDGVPNANDPCPMDAPNDPDGDGQCGVFRIEQCWVGGGAPNHCDPNSDMDYDIWQSNCHTAANLPVLTDPNNTGIVVCGGQPEGPGNPGDHTFNYVLSGNPPTTVYYNWGERCPAVGSCQGAPPANLGAGGCHATCVARFCDGQWDGGADERILPPGQLVEIPGPAVCVRETSNANGGSFDAGLFGACRDCCNTRADTWPNRPNYCQRGRDSEDFRAACTYLCEGFFLNGHPNGPQPPASCPYWPSVRACDVAGRPTTTQQITAECEALDYAGAAGTPQERRCFSDCVSHTQAAQANCVPRPRVCPYRPSVRACNADGSHTTRPQIEAECEALDYAAAAGTTTEQACYSDCVAQTLATQASCVPAVPRCSYHPSVRACEVGGQPVALAQIEADCEALDYAAAAGTPDEEVCFAQCLQNTVASQINCPVVPPPLDTGLVRETAVVPLP